LKFFFKPPLGGFLRMHINLNEKQIKLQSPCPLVELIEHHRPGADIIIVNGYPATPAHILEDGDRVVLIRRGEKPSAAELEQLMMARHSPGVHQQLKQSCVGIAGVGGLGSQVAVALARVGVGRLLIADFDLVEPSNLNRQHYFVDQIGQPKVTALRETLSRINPATEVQTFPTRITSENLATIFAPVDLLIEAFDRADQKAMLTNTFLQRFPDKYLVAASGMAGYGDANRIRTRRITARFYLCGDGETAAQPGCGLMAPRVGVAAHHQANIALRLLLNRSEERDHGIDD
jgi:sulfur carrier protein ThiS adenylyltransferase